MTNKLSEKERRFVDAYLGKAAGNGKQAAIAAGYSARSAEVTGSRLIRKANVVAELEKRRLSLVKASIADATERREIMTSMLRDKEGHPLARLKATDILNKMDGVYIQKHEHAGPGGQPIQVITGVPQPDGDR